MYDHQISNYQVQDRKSKHTEFTSLSPPASYHKIPFLTIELRRVNKRNISSRASTGYIFAQPYSRFSFPSFFTCQSNPFKKESFTESLLALASFNPSTWGSQTDNSSISQGERTTLLFLRMNGQLLSLTARSRSERTVPEQSNNKYRQNLIRCFSNEKT